LDQRVRGFVVQSRVGECMVFQNYRNIGVVPTGQLSI
jgi:hypothetical protein